MRNGVRTGFWRAGFTLLLGSALVSCGASGNGGSATSGGGSSAPASSTLGSSSGTSSTSTSSRGSSGTAGSSGSSGNASSSNGGSGSSSVAGSSSSGSSGGSGCGTNLLANPSFATNTNGWMGYQSTLTQVANSSAPGGPYAALVTEASAANNGSGFSIQGNPATVPSATAGNSYTATGYVAASAQSSVGKTIQLVLREEDSGGNIVQLWIATSTLTTSFQELATSATVQNSGDSLDLYVFQSDSAAGDAFFAADLTFEQACSASSSGGGGSSSGGVSSSSRSSGGTSSSSSGSGTSSSSSGSGTSSSSSGSGGTQAQCPCATAPAMPTAVPSGYTRIFGEDFNTAATVGNFDNVYGTEFGEYIGPAPQPDGSEAAYVPTEVLSVANGSLFYDLHTDSSGTPVAAAPQPMNSQGFLYGQVGIAIKMDSETEPQNYKIAFLLWPTTGAWTNEVDFAETQPDLDVDFSVNSLLTDNSPNFDLTDGNQDTGVNLTDGMYHTFLVTWTATALTVSIDGITKATFSAGSGADPAQQMRVSLQAEGWIPGGNNAISPASAAVVEVPYIYINQYN